LAFLSNEKSEVPSFCFVFVVVVGLCGFPNKNNFLSSFCSLLPTPKETCVSCYRGCTTFFLSSSCCEEKNSPKRKMNEWGKKTENIIKQLGIILNFRNVKRKNMDLF